MKNSKWAIPIAMGVVFFNSIAALSNDHSSVPSPCTTDGLSLLAQPGHLAHSLSDAKLKWNLIEKYAFGNGLLTERSFRRAGILVADQLGKRYRAGKNLSSIKLSNAEFDSANAAEKVVAKVLSLYSEEPSDAVDRVKRSGKVFERGREIARDLARSPQLKQDLIATLRYLGPDYLKAMSDMSRELWKVKFSKTWILEAELRSQKEAEFAWFRRPATPKNEDELPTDGSKKISDSGVSGDLIVRSEAFRWAVSSVVDLLTRRFGPFRATATKSYEIPANRLGGRTLALIEDAFDPALFDLDKGKIRPGGKARWIEIKEQANLSGREMRKGFKLSQILRAQPETRRQLESILDGLGPDWFAEIGTAASRHNDLQFKYFVNSDPSVAIATPIVGVPLFALFGTFNLILAAIPDKKTPRLENATPEDYLAAKRLAPPVQEETRPRGLPPYQSPFTKVLALEGPSPQKGGLALREGGALIASTGVSLAASQWAQSLHERVTPAVSIETWAPLVSKLDEVIQQVDHGAVPLQVEASRQLGAPLVDVSTLLNGLIQDLGLLEADGHSLHTAMKEAGEGASQAGNSALQVQTELTRHLNSAIAPTKAQLMFLGTMVENAHDMLVGTISNPLRQKISPEVVVLLKNLKGAIQASIRN